MKLKLEPILFLVVGTCFCLIRSIICNLKSSTSYCISRTLLFVYETQSCILGLPCNARNKIKFQNRSMHFSAFHHLSVSRQFLSFKILPCIIGQPAFKALATAFSSVSIGLVIFNNLNYIFDLFHLFQVHSALVSVHGEFFLAMLNLSNFYTISCSLFSWPLVFQCLKR